MENSRDPESPDPNFYDEKEWGSFDHSEMDDAQAPLEPKKTHPDDEAEDYSNPTGLEPDEAHELEQAEKLKRKKREEEDLL